MRTIGLASYFLLFSVGAGAQLTLDQVSYGTRTDHLQRRGYKGLGTTLVIVDGRPRETHQDFMYPATSTSSASSKLTVLGFSPDIATNDHGSHVAGIALALGVKGARYVGMAPGANGICLPKNKDNDSYIFGDNSVIDGFSPSTVKKIIISNHSYGAGMGIGLGWKCGAYKTYTQKADEFAFKRYGWLPVVSAGNDGQNGYMNTSPSRPGYDMLVGDLSNCKNALVVGAMSAIQRDGNGRLIGGSVAAYSSMGPTDDRRIKPDIMGYGGTQNMAIHSCGFSADDNYVDLSGTSQACPNVSGTLLLLQEHYKSQIGRFARAATIKGLALHTADDVTAAPASVGPDLFSGWGVLNASAAAKVIDNIGGSARLYELRLNQNGKWTQRVYSDGTMPLQASISWTDPAGQAVPDGTQNSTASVLVNNLDVLIEKESPSTKYYPYSLNTDYSLLTNKENNRDNFERVDIPAPSKGYYNITVTHQGTLTFPTPGEDFQRYTIIITGIGLEQKDRTDCGGAASINIQAPVAQQGFIAPHISASSALFSSASGRAKRDLAEEDYYNIDLPDDGVVHLEAFDEVLLLPGFYATSEHGFVAKIIPCFDDSPPPSTTVFNNAVSIQSAETPVVTSISGDEKLLVYPNPTTGLFSVSGIGPEVVYLTVSTTDGKKMAGFNMNSKAPWRDLDISKLAAGMYVLQLQSSDGQVQIRKIIKY